MPLSFRGPANPTAGMFLSAFQKPGIVPGAGLLFRGQTFPLGFMNLDTD
jgi:hypothetical protein